MQVKFLIIKDSIFVRLTIIIKKTTAFLKNSIGLFKSQFFKNVSIVVGGTTIAQAITLLCSPIITRLFSPEAFGALGVMTSLVTTLLPVASLTYPYAIVLPKEDKDGLALIKISLAIGGVVSFVILILLLIFRQGIARLLNLTSFSDYLLLIPLTLFFFVTMTTFDQWLFRKKQFRSSSLITVSQSIISNGGSIAAGLLVLGDVYLLVIYTLAQGFHAIVSFIISQKSINLQSKVDINLVRILDEKTKIVMRDYDDFPRYRAPQILANSLSRSLPILLLTIFSGPIAAGFYTLSQRVLSLPSIVVADSFGKVLLPKLADHSHQGNSLQPLIIRSTIGLVAIGIVPFSILVVFSPLLFSLVFGSNWYEAGEMARWMAIGLFFMFINVPSVKAIPILDLQKQFLFFEIISVLIRAAGFLLGMLIWHDDLLAVAIFSIVNALIYVTLIFSVIFISKEKNRFSPSK